MSRYQDITLGGQTVKKHVRDIAKDAVMLALAPELSRPGACLRIYESSAGSAYLSRQLADQGHKVVISNYRTQGIPGVQEVEADLNVALPFDTAGFDVILCREVIEHVESVPHTLREFQRLLTPGGRLVMTFPNRLQIRSRLFHLLSGFYRGMKSPINLDVAFGEAHINLIGYPEMDYFLRKSGFAVTGVSSSYFSASDRLLAPLRPVIRAATLHALLSHKPHAEEHDKTSPLNRAYNRFIADVITSPDLFYGKDVIVSAVRVADGMPAFPAP
ncbi:MAG: class I SAM-dependent methyltransferase [Humidesulfovibrio sp.]|uniref:class I SAM-dependent methyltransferase n=1 Tax=Humidesulfovibrio sp. TaxID=2910988 RepID=UPI0027F0043B|nr:class I SAM-dependent methyltransferase [Humidesulfovibrio sp.]MDQ7836484.1 class I SAM-dependent methyltransferase [Humidesulfovibrio sp.]